MTRPSKQGSRGRGWFAESLQDEEFQRLLECENFVEQFLASMEVEMARQKISRAELARRLSCSAANITQIFRQTRNLTAATMVDIAWALELRLRLAIEAFASGERQSPENWMSSSTSTCEPNLGVTERPQDWSVGLPDPVRLAS